MGEMEIPDELIDRLLGEYEGPEQLTGPDGLINRLRKRLIERAAGAELEEHLGYTGDQLKAIAGDSVDALLHQDDLAPVREQYRRFDPAPDGEVLEWEFRLRHADSTYRWFHVRATVFDRSDNGRVRRIIGHSRDVTVQKETETALRRFSEDLEKLVANRTDDLV